MAFPPAISIAQNSSSLNPSLFLFLPPCLANHRWSDFPCTGITLRARRALRVIWNILLGAKHLSRCWAPGRAAQNQKYRRSVHFFKNSGSYTATLEQKLEYQTNFPGPLVYLIRRALIWNNLFLMQNAKRIHGSREIFEKLLRKTPPITSACFTICDQISPAPVLLLEQERLYESCEIIIPWAKHLSRCWAPGRAEKNQKYRRSVHFFNNSRSYTKTLEQKLEYQTNFPRPLVYLIRRALIWNNLLLMHHAKRIHGTREIFEKLIRKTPPITGMRAVNRRPGFRAGGL